MQVASEAGNYLTMSELGKTGDVVSQLQSIATFYNYNLLCIYPTVSLCQLWTFKRKWVSYISCLQD